MNPLPRIADRFDFPRQRLVFFYINTPSRQELINTGIHCCEGLAQCSGFQNERKAPFSRYLQILGSSHQTRLPILSFVIKADDSFFDYQTFTRLLSDHYGIQARGGCSCAGPYVHRLLCIDDNWSNRLRHEILSGDESHKPGFIRLNLSYLMDDDTVDFILSSVAELAVKAPELAKSQNQQAA